MFHAGETTFLLRYLAMGGFVTYKCRALVSTATVDSFISERG